MRSQPTIQPGVIQNFRTFSGVRFMLVLLGLVFGILAGPSAPPVDRNHIPRLLLVVLLDPLLLVLYLSCKPLMRRLRGGYLPLGIAWATLMPLLEQHVAYSFYANNRIQENAVLLSAWQLVPILFIPLVVIAWQYSFRQVILFCGLTALVDLTPLAFTTVSGLPHIPYFSLVGVVFIRTVTFLFVGNMIANMTRIQSKQRRELTEANTRLARYALTLEQLTISRERNRLARELHDVLAHTLSGVAVELEAVRALWDLDSTKSKAMLAHSLQATRDGLTETRRALQELRAMPLEDLGLGLAVRGLAEGLTSRSAVKVETHIADELGNYPPEVQQTVYRVAQEALSNAAQHAGAGCVSVRLAEEDRQLKLVIADDGQGFDPESLPGDQQFGLRGMRERVEMIGGQLSVESHAGQGTTIVLTYPTPANSPGEG
jgi:signal transduction histidine kinase